MVYTRNQPVAPDDLSVSQPFLFNNTNASDDSFGIDHYPFSDLTTNNGKHKKVTLVAQSPAPAEPSSAAVLTYGLTQSGITMPYYKRDSVTTEFPLAPIKVYASMTASAINIVTLLDSFNVTSVTAAGVSPNQTFTFTLSTPMRTTNYGILVTSTRTSSGFSYSVINTSSFTVTISGIPSSFVAYNLTVLALET